MAQHNEFEIDSAWEMIEVTSNRGDKAIYRINSISKEVLMQTSLGDGNQFTWRGCNVSYEAIKKANHVPIGNEPVLPAPMSQPVKHQHKPKENALDLESIAPSKPL